MVDRDLLEQRDEQDPLPAGPIAHTNSDVEVRLFDLCFAPLQALFGELSWDVTILTVLYSIAGLGIAIVNDFKSIEGDKCALSY